MSRPLPGAVDPSDRGEVDPPLAAALAVRRDETAVLTAFAAARVFVGIEARARGRDEATGADRESDMELLTLRVPSGATAVPAFSRLATLTAWRSSARPVPVRGAELCVEAVRLGHSAIVLDAGGPGAVTIDGDDLAALAAGRVPAPTATLRRPDPAPAKRDRDRLARGLRRYAGRVSVWPAEIGAAGDRWVPVLVAVAAGEAPLDADLRRALEAGPGAGRAGGERRAAAGRAAAGRAAAGRGTAGRGTAGRGTRRRPLALRREAGWSPERVVILDGVPPEDLVAPLGADLLGTHPGK